MIRPCFDILKHPVNYIPQLRQIDVLEILNFNRLSKFSNMDRHYSKIQNPPMDNSKILSRLYLYKHCDLVFLLPRSKLLLCFPQLLLTIIINLIKRGQLVSSNFQYIFQEVSSHRIGEPLEYIFMLYTSLLDAEGPSIQQEQFIKELHSTRYTKSLKT